jgi:hypothetical protein
VALNTKINPKNPVKTSGCADCGRVDLLQGPNINLVVLIVALNTGLIDTKCTVKVN